MRRPLPADARVAINDVTSAWAMLSLQGPRSRALLAELMPASLASEDFPYLAAREVEIGYSRVQAVRITYLGELGYELYVRTEHALDVYDRITVAGGGFGLRHAGLQALTRLRMEKAYRDWGYDIDNIDTPFEAGLGFAVKLVKAGGSIGRDALARQRAEGPPRRRLLQFLLEDPEPLLHHGEVIWRDGARVGYVRVGAWGFTLGAAASTEAACRGLRETLAYPAVPADVRCFASYSGAEVAVTRIGPVARAGDSPNPQSPILNPLSECAMPLSAVAR